MQELINASGTALSTIFHFILHFLGFLFILFAGWLISLGMKKAVALLLGNLNFHSFSDRIGLTTLEQKMGIQVNMAQILEQTAFWFVFLVFLVQATNTLGLPVLSSMLNRVVNYLPNVFVALIVLVLGSLAAIFVSDLVRRTQQVAHLGNQEILANSIRWGIVGISCLVALQQLEIAPILITILFTAIVGGFALAFGLSFGLGGRDSVQRLLARGESMLLSRLPYNPDKIVQKAQVDLTHSEQMEYHYRDTDPETDFPPLSELSVAIPGESGLKTPRIEPHA